MEPGIGGEVDKKGQENKVVLQISEKEEAFYVKTEETIDFKGSPITESTSHSFQHNTQMGSSLKGYKDSTIELAELGNVKCGVQVSSFTRLPSPEMKYSSPKPSKPPKILAKPITSRRSLARSEFSKPKSRFVELPYPTDLNLVEEKTQLTSSNLSNRNSANMAPPNTVRRLKGM